MKRLTFLTLLLALLLTSICCKQTAEDRYQRYLEEVADTSEFEYITPDKDPVKNVDDEGYDPLADDGKGIVTVPDIPQQRSVNMNADTYELEKMMMGKQ
jgi:hypothetical protein